MNKAQNRQSGTTNWRIDRGIQWVFLSVMVFVSMLVVGCSSGANEQATAEAVAQVEQSRASTAEAEMLAATSQAIEDAKAALDEATQEAERAANMQATAEHEATVTALTAANEQATADAQATMSAEATASAIETMVAQATAEAMAVATASYKATQEALRSEQLRTMKDAQFETAVVDMDEGRLVHDNDEDPETQAIDVDLRNFVAQTQFSFDLGETDLEDCDFGLGFRSVDENATYLLLYQTGNWQLISSEEGDEEVIQEGQTDEWRDGWNELALYVDEEGGFFSLNGAYVEALDLEHSAEKGDIVLVTGMGQETEADGAAVLFRQLQVWSMDPIPPTPTPAPTSSAPQQPVSSAAHTFPETPIKPFDRDEFVSFVGQLRDSFRSYTSEMDLMETTHKPGDCGTFNGWLGLWIVRSPGYTDVPPSFASLYREYRSMLRDVVNLSQEIRTVCNAGGGLVSDETIDGIIEFLSWAYPRSEQMVSEASALPAP